MSTLSIALGLTTAIFLALLFAFLWVRSQKREEPFSAEPNLGMNDSKHQLTPLLEKGRGNREMDRFQPLRKTA